jgi:polar amino acid transport system permease protein
MPAFEWRWNVLNPYYGNFLEGLVITGQLSGIIIAGALFFGVILGAARYSKRRIFNWPATLYIEMFRNTPILVQIVWFFYAFPVLVGGQIEPFMAAVFGIGLNITAYSAEIFRGGIQSLDRGQWEAGRAIGMSYFQVMRRVILPQAIRRMVPAFANRMIEAVKATSLASTIAVADLMWQGEMLANAIYRPFEVYTAVAVIYFLAIYPLVLGTYGIERWLRIDEEVKL